MNLREGPALPVLALLLRSRCSNCYFIRLLNPMTRFLYKQPKKMHRLSRLSSVELTIGRGRRCESSATLTIQKVILKPCMCNKVHNAWMLFSARRAYGNVYEKAKWPAWKRHLPLSRPRCLRDISPWDHPDVHLAPFGSIMGGDKDSQRRYQCHWIKWTVLIAVLYSTCFDCIHSMTVEIFSQNRKSILWKRALESGHRMNLSK